MTDASAATVRPLSGRIGIFTAKARMPFRFGVVTVRAAAGATLALDVMVEGRRVTGYASELLAYKWFDKRPEKTPRDNVNDLLDTLNAALNMATQLGAGSVFQLWQQIDGPLHDKVRAAEFNDLGASFGVAMIERALMDAVLRAKGMSFFAGLTSGAFGIDAGAVHPELKGRTLAQALPQRALGRVAIRHTIGMLDPITDADMTPDMRTGDGLPETLEEYIRADQLRFLKIKLAGNVEADCARLTAIAGAMARAPHPIQVTLDGNEQFKDLAGFADFIARLRAQAGMADVLDRALFIEQPLDRAMTFAAPLDPAALHEIGLPLLIDEADGWTTAFRDAMDLGYRGVSHKNCKGVIRSLLNAMLVQARNGAAGAPVYFQSSEDLTCMPVLSLNSDLALISALGLTHTERNSHHYFAGLGHLSDRETAQALAAHPDLYGNQGGAARLRTESGFLSTGSLDAAGFGTACVPDMDALTPAAEWSFDTLGINDNSA